MHGQNIMKGILQTLRGLSLVERIWQEPSHLPQTMVLDKSRLYLHLGGIRVIEWADTQRVLLGCWKHSLPH